MLSIVVPCYNEAFRLPPLLALIDGNAERGWEWLLVDDGSGDRSPSMLAEFAAHTRADVRLLAHPENLGKGAAVRTGALAARQPMLGFVDADLAASPLDFQPFLDDPDLRQGNSLLIGIRLLTEEVRVRRHPLRHILGRLYQTYVAALTGLAVYDTQCGFKLLASNRARQLFGQMRCNGFAFDVELILLAKAAGMRVREVPIAWEEKFHSRVRPWTAARMFCDVLAMRRRLGRTTAGRTGA